MNECQSFNKLNNKNIYSNRNSYPNNKHDFNYMQTFGKLISSFPKENISKNNQQSINSTKKNFNRKKQECTKKISDLISKMLEYEAKSKNNINSNTTYVNPKIEIQNDKFQNLFKTPKTFSKTIMSTSNFSDFSTTNSESNYLSNSENKIFSRKNSYVENFCNRVPIQNTTPFILPPQIVNTYYHYVNPYINNIFNNYSTNYYINNNFIFCNKSNCMNNNCNFEEEEKNCIAIKNDIAERKKENTPILEIIIKISDNEIYRFILKRYDDLFQDVEIFCEINKIKTELIGPIIMYIFKALNTIYSIMNIPLNKNEIEFLQKIKNMEST